MASRQVLLLAAAAIAATVTFFPSMTVAVEYKVGDDAGWTLKYPGNWADGKTFRVGDTLVFKYPMDKHDVTEVGGEAFKSCNTTSTPPVKYWNTGNDTVNLDKAGKRWFYCGVDDHCKQGLKLVVNVSDVVHAPAPAPPPAPAPSSAALNYKVGGAVAQAMLAAGAVIAPVLMF